MATNPAYTPEKRKLKDVGGTDAFQSWLEEEEEDWKLGQMLAATCPAEFICPISLDIMEEPVILVGIFQHSGPQDWCCLCFTSSLVCQARVMLSS